MFKQKPPISDGKASYVKLVFLNILFPTMFPLHSAKRNGLEKNGPRKIKTYIEKRFNGSKVQIHDVDKPNGIKSEQSVALREDIFDLMMISAQLCTLPWSPERLQYLRHFFPTLPLGCIDAQ